MRAMIVRPVLLATVAAVLVLPGSASAIVSQLGSNLQAAPNVTFGCEFVPQISNFAGDQFLVPSGQTDCTWRQSGVFGSTDPNETRFSSVPGDGRITKVEVRTGANPAPLRFVVIRQLGNVGGTANSQCCFFRSETEPVTMAPNTVNTVNLNIPVERNTLNGIRAFDLVGISAAAGQGALPLLETGPHNINTVLTNGAVDAGYFYPRMGAIANDSGGGRLEAGTSGYELTVRWTWVSADDPSLVGGPAGTPLPPTLAAAAATVREGRVSFALRCAANEKCAGAAQVLARGAGGRATAAAKKPVSYGKASYSIAAGKKATLKVKLTAAARKALKRKRKLAATLTLTPKGGTAVSKKVTLKR